MDDLNALRQRVSDLERVVSEIQADIHGLKATLTGAQQGRFDQARRGFLEAELPSGDSDAS